MMLLGVALSLPLIALALALAALPVWLAAKVLGAGQSELWRAMVALVLATVLTVGAILSTGLWSLLLGPAIFVIVFAKMLDLSYVGAFVLCILAMAFQVLINKFMAGLFG